ncbi:exported protein of unknown function [Hyphomicrobium sp. 1Nfss2.1]|uniref:hypothetical protein n=1 Tax=Hyphomicrobium sp. 1Nfss2.1 TaxID=3413936 RepID=UPI003C7D0CF5
MRILLALLLAVSISACTRSLAIEKEMDQAVSELDKSIWSDGLKPIVKPEKDKGLPPLK